MTDKTTAILPIFMGELHAFCKRRRGRLNQLAADLQTAQPTVSAWINLKQEPRAEMLLRLMQWLDHAKAAEAAELAHAATKTANALKSLASRRDTPPAE